MTEPSQSAPVDPPVIDEGASAALEAEKERARAKERTDVDRWSKRIASARKFDESARQQYAKDRRYARGDSGFQVGANIIGTNIDILESFLYARDPDFDVKPGPSVRPPDMLAMRDAIEDQIRQSPQVVQAGAQAAAAAVSVGTPMQMAFDIGRQAQESAIEVEIKQAVDELRRRYVRRNRDIKAFAETCEIVGVNMWQAAQIRRRGRPWVRSALTIGIGVLKATWQQRSEQSPETARAINDLTDNLQRARSLQAELSEQGVFAHAVDAVKGVFGADREAKVAELERQLAALQGQAEQVTARGFAMDVVAGEDFEVAPGYTIANHIDAPWNAHRTFIHADEALPQFREHLSQHGDPDAILRRATRYRARKPVMVQDESAMVDNVRAKDADAYTTEGEGDSEQGDDFLCLREIWDRNSNTVLTYIDGVPYWVKPQWTPPATSRFYPFFLFSTSEVDGQRHPQSLVSRTMKLVDEYERIGSAEATHRRRIIPKIAFNRGAMSPEDADALAGADTQEMIGINPTDPRQPIGEILHPVAYAAIDVALYDRTRIVQEIERIWGVQEALGGSINTPKTATEADIQQQGFTARTSGRRDALEACMSDLAQYTIEIARVYMTAEQVREIAGPDAMWPQYVGPDDLSRLINIEIRGGSSGKPNTTAEREAWGVMLPLLQQGIVQIGQLRNSTPAAIADSLEHLLRLTAEKSGDRIDIDQLIPTTDGAAPQPQMPMGQPMPGAPPPPDAPPGGDPAADPLIP